MEISEFLTWLVLYIFGFLAGALILREAVAWYYKINELRDLLKNQNRLSGMLLRTALYGKEEVKKEYEAWQKEIEQDL